MWKREKFCYIKVYKIKENSMFHFNISVLLLNSQMSLSLIMTFNLALSLLNKNTELHYVKYVVN